MGFFRIFCKKNVQEAYLPKMSISGQLVSEMLAGYTQKTPYNPSNFLGGSNQKKFTRVCMEFSRQNWATISETICPEMPIFGEKASWTFFFQNILTNPIISEISFLWRHTLVLYWAFWVLAKDWFDAMAHCTMPASFPVVLGDFSDVTSRADVTCQACRENSPRTLGSKPPLATRTARTGLGTRLALWNCFEGAILFNDYY